MSPHADRGRARAVRAWLGATASPRGSVAVLAAASLIVLFAGAGSKEIHGTSIFYASLARDIADAGDVLGIYRGADAYLLKPPALVWLTALAVKLLGPTSFAGTLFARLSGVAVVLLTYALGRRLFGPAAAWLGAVMLLTNSTFHQFSSALRMDALMTAGVLLAVIGYLEAGRRWGPYAFFGGLALGLLAKGPQVLGVLLLVPAHALVLGRWPPLRRCWPAALLLSLPLAWYGWLLSEHGARVWQELAADAARGGSESIQLQLSSAWREYVHKPLLRFWPWLPLLLAGCVYGGYRCTARGVTRAVRADAGLLLVWVGAVFVAAAIKPDHDLRYVYPALPPLSLLAGALAAHLLRQQLPRWALALAACLAAGLFVATLVPGLLGKDTRPAIAAMHRRLDAALAPGEPVLVVGFHVNNPPGPRRQSTHVDWVHYYFGRDAHVIAPHRARAADVAAAPVVLVARYGKRAQVLAALDLETLVAGEEMVLAVSRHRRDARGAR
ncbi:MAG: glycosyltransferase family 39 protein [Gammaproteobacteria bacterium]|nr:glycosyltransferase family 39 protein [Gammaproteobacteria bacterium]